MTLHTHTVCDLDVFDPNHVHYYADITDTVLLSNFRQDFEAYGYRCYLNLTTSYDRKWVVLEPEMGGARQKLLM